jgi:GcrA cell cycle regulator
MRYSEAHREAIRVGVQKRNDGYRQFTDEQVIAAIDGGDAIGELIAKFKCHPRVIHRIARENNRNIARAATNGNGIIWNDAITAKLRTLWAEGHSTAEIGRRLGVSKNSIVGRVNRLDLPKRPSPLRPRRVRSTEQVIRAGKIPLLLFTTVAVVPPRSVPVARVEIPKAKAARPAGTAPTSFRPISPVVDIVGPPMPGAVRMPGERQCLAVSGPRFKQVQCLGEIARGSFCSDCAERFYKRRDVA